MSPELEWVRSVSPPGTAAASLMKAGLEMLTLGDLHRAAAALDCAFGLDPQLPGLAMARQSVLDRLSVVALGIQFRYVPAGPFWMGSETGDEDEAPVHRVELDPFWISDTPLSWAAFRQLMGWSLPPPSKEELVEGAGHEDFMLHQENKIRLQYCEDGTIQARDWHAHAPLVGLVRPFAPVPRQDPRQPLSYEVKPMVCVSWQEALRLCERISTGSVVHTLPTEAQWEKAARGGLSGCSYSWGNDSPNGRCDYDRFREFSILASRRFPPNGYGLYAMNGTVWEWTSDWYDALYYREGPPTNPTGPEQGEQKVLRGGSWTDCAEAVTVSFRMSSAGHLTPNVGFRLCRLQPSALTGAR